MIYLWTEDSGSGHHFWELINENMFEGKLCVESKNSNQGLLDAVRELTPAPEDKYILAFDIVYDNMDIMNKYLELIDIINKYPENIFNMDLNCFEYLILSFDKLVEWTGCNKKDKIVIRAEIIAHIKEHRIDIESIKEKSTLRYLMGFKRYSTEKVIKALTYEMTENDEWSVKGQKLGRCWYEDCCVSPAENKDKRKCGCGRHVIGEKKFMELVGDRQTKLLLDELRRIVRVSSGIIDIL